MYSREQLPRVTQCREGGQSKESLPVADPPVVAVSRGFQAEAMGFSGQPLTLPWREPVVG